MSNLAVVVKLVGVVRFESTGVTHVLLCMFGHVFLQGLLGLTTKKTIMVRIVEKKSFLGHQPDQAAFNITGQPAFMLDPDVPLFVLPIYVALSHLEMVHLKIKRPGHKGPLKMIEGNASKNQHLAQPCCEARHIRALAVPSLNLVPELVLLQLSLAGVPILCLVREFLPTVWTEELFPRGFAVPLPLLLLMVLVDVLNNLFL